MTLKAMTPDTIFLSMIAVFTVGFFLGRMYEQVTRPRCGCERCRREAR
jgi:hypothetical protein